MVMSRLVRALQPADCPVRPGWAGRALRHLCLRGSDGGSGSRSRARHRGGAAYLRGPRCWESAQSHPGGRADSWGHRAGLGMALMEEYVSGRTDNLHDYLIPTCGDIPTITTYLVEDPEPLGPYGAKGVGTRCHRDHASDFACDLPCHGCASAVLARHTRSVAESHCSNCDERLNSFPSPAKISEAGCETSILIANLPVIQLDTMADALGKKPWRLS